MTLNLSRILALPCIGEGNFRRVYRDGNYVYKVETAAGMEFGSNGREYVNYHTLLSTALPDNVALPDECSLLIVGGHDVIRMSFVAGKVMGDCMCLAPVEPCGDDCLPIDLAETLTLLGIDCAYGNVIQSTDGTYVLVDLDADLR